MKVTISVPDALFKAAEQLLLQLKTSRSQLYARALAAHLDACDSARVTGKLDAIYGSKPSRVDPDLALAQSQAIADELW